MYTDDDQNTTNEPKSSTPSPNNSTPKSDDQNVSQLRTTDMDLSFGTATIKNNNCSTFERDPSLTSTLRSEQKSILKSGQRSNDSNINVQSLSTSSPTVDENTSSNGAVTPKGTSLKVAGLSTIFRYDSSPSSGQSSARSPKGVGAKFKLFNKIKSAVSKPKSEKSTLRVGSVSSSSKENSSSSSFMSAIRSQLKIRSYSSSPKESSSQNTSSTMPIIMLDITENGSLKNEQPATAEIETNNFLEKGQITVKSEDIIDPKSEGFEVHAIDELERTISMESKLFGMKKKKHNLLKSE
ncbi:hypothetical protein DPMN_157251 [Dreissena polymorpha]|uniref:Uncharacterized protein n=1 Tax=Dreissena polymorpha TaxID=45954 RepID=A0A9D4IPU1_DREPO|nr:hypothetical protein DPMN_157251 [Dreissena polymorpha]